MDNRLREIEQWVAEARDGLGDGGREAYVHKLYLLDAEIRAVIKDSGILPQVVSPRPATSLVRHLSSLALPVASAVVVLAVATVYLRSGILNADNSILTARPESAQKNTPPAGPSSPSTDWQQYLANNGETVIEFATLPVEVEQPVVLASNQRPMESTPARPALAPATASKAGPDNMTEQGKTVKPVSTEDRPATTPTKAILASTARPAQVEANESTSVAASPVILAGYLPAPAEEAPAETQPAPRKVKNRKASKPVESGDEVEIDIAALQAKLTDAMDRRSKTE